MFDMAEMKCQNNETRAEDAYVRQTTIYFVTEQENWWTKIIQGQLRFCWVSPVST